MDKFKRPMRICALIVSLLVCMSMFTGINFANPVSKVEDQLSVAYAADYYDSLDTSLSGTAFRSSLAKLITDTHKKQTTYAELATVFKTSDADPDNPGKIKWFYTGTSVSFSDFGSGIGTTNREHVWPKSAGNAFPANTKTGSDAHHLRPAEAQLNSTRNNLSFNEVPQTTSNIVKENGSSTYANLCYTDGTFFYPGKGYRGATARILMYVQTRWGDEFSLKFVDGAGSVKTIGKISTLMKWHLEEPPTQDEITRNEVVYGIQGNRNPFIDHPEYASKIYCSDGESYNAAVSAVVAQYGDYASGTADIEYITLSTSALNLVKGQTSKINYTLKPSNALNDLVWESSNTSVAKVANGTVTAVGDGSATISVHSASNSSVSASLIVKVKSVKDIAISGSLIKKNYTEGESFNPTGLTVTLTYTDGTTAVASNDSVEWLDANTRKTALSIGTNSVVCVSGSVEKTVSGITVEKMEGTVYTITRANFVGSGAYTWATWSTDGLSGRAYMYPGTTSSIQMNNSKPSYYLFNTTAMPSGIISVTLVLNENAKNWELLTSNTPYVSDVSKYPTTGTSHGTLKADTDGVTWELDGTDKYFSLNYVDGGVTYIKSITIVCGTKNAVKDFSKAVSEVQLCLGDNESKLDAISKAVSLYEKLSAEEKAQASDDYKTLVAEIDSYNQAADEINAAAQRAEDNSALIIFASILALSAVAYIAFKG